VSSIRPWLPAALVATMLLSGCGTYLLLGSHQSSLRQQARTPTQVAAPAPALLLPGTMYLVQGGAIYSLSAGKFSQVTQPAGWAQVAALPDGSGLIAVKRSTIYSDLYQLGLDGHVVAQLTHNAAPSRFYDIGVNHWSFYPSVQAGTQSIFMSYDSAKQGDYEVDLAIWQIPLNGSRSGWRQWSFPVGYTGGDVQPLPLASGGLLYVKYDQDDNGNKSSQIWYKASRNASSTALTSLADDCSQPSLSPDGTTLAMVCSYQQQRAQLELAPFNGSSIGPRRVIISDRVVAQPAWAPDGSGIAFLSPAIADQPFQLWWLPKSGYAPPPVPSPSPSPVASASPKATKSPKPSPSPTPVPPAKPIQVTTDLGFDATSPIAWRP
jgi:Tol biopolymer transport system component